MSSSVSLQYWSHRSRSSKKHSTLNMAFTEMYLKSYKHHLFCVCLKSTLSYNWPVYANNVLNPVYSSLFSVVAPLHLATHTHAHGSQFLYVLHFYDPFIFFMIEFFCCTGHSSPPPPSLIISSISFFVNNSPSTYLPLIKMN